MSLDGKSFLTTLYPAFSSFSIVLVTSSTLDLVKLAPESPSSTTGVDTTLPFSSTTFLLSSSNYFSSLNT